MCPLRLCTSTGMKHYVGYHNEEKTGMACGLLPYPRLRTRRNVYGLEGSTVWVVAGVGTSPKRYVLASTFTIERCSSNKYPGDELPNEVSGPGTLLGESVELNGTGLLDDLQRISANFASGLREIKDPSVIAELERLV